MNKTLMKLFILTLLMLLNNFCYASRITGIAIGVKRLISIQFDGLSVLRSIFNQQQELNQLIGKTNSHLVGHSGWGSYQFHDYQSYGKNANDWSQVLSMAELGQGSGELGKMIVNLSREFPQEFNAYNNGIKDIQSQRYYALRAKTILASRAASQLDYNKIEAQIVYQQMLAQQIEKTKDIKAAMDLSNRIQVEGNLINLEILRQTAINNQQQVINEQASLNAALDNAKFLTKNRRHK